MRSRRYGLHSTWQVDAGVAPCWEFLTSPDQRWLDWWPSLSEISVSRTDAIVGSRADCVWRSPLGHRLRMGMTLAESAAGSRIALVIDGDVTGRGVVGFSGDETTSRLDIALDLEAASRWINVTTPVLRPLFTLGHHVVMRRGERGLNAELRAQVIDGEPLA